MLTRVAKWFDDRLGTSAFARTALNKVFPDHWSFMIGEVALYCFIVLVLTGTFLAFFFHATSEEVIYHGSYEPLQGIEMSDAYASVLHISFDVPVGLVMRQIHHWAALLFIISITAHLCRVFFTGAFRRPREINWLIGVTLLILAIFNGFTGYSLPDDLLSGTGLRIAYSIALSVPVIGTWIAFLLFGGEFPAEQIIARLFVIHVYLIPIALGILISLHLAIIWRQKHTQFPGPRRTESNVVGSRLWPTYAFKSVGLFFAMFAVLGLLGGLVQINPVWLYGPFRPASVVSPAQPDYYLGWVEGALRLMPPWEIQAFGYTIPNPFFPAVLLPGITFGLLYIWPFLERRFTKDDRPHELLDRPTQRPVRSAIGAGVLTFYAVLLLAASNDIIALSLRVPVGLITNIFRVLVFVLPLLVAGVIYRWFKAVVTTGAPDAWHVPLSAVVRRRTAVPPKAAEG